MKITNVKKGITITTIFLLISLAFAPSIHANIPKGAANEDLVEITIEICGISGKKSQTMKLTKEDAEAVRQLFNDIKVKLKIASTRIEAIELFNEAIVALHEHDLLGDLSIRQAQKVVTGRYENPLIIRFVERINSKHQIRGEVDYINLFCLIAAYMNKYCENYCLSYWLAVYLENIFFSTYNFGYLILAIILFGYSVFHPIRKLNNIVNEYNSETTMLTLGLLGLKDSTSFEEIFGFTGIKVTFNIFTAFDIEDFSAFYLGFAVWVK